MTEYKHVIKVPKELVYELWCRGISTWSSPVGVPKLLKNCRINTRIQPKSNYPLFKDPNYNGSYAHIDAKPILYQLTCKLKDIL